MHVVLLCVGLKTAMADAVASIDVRGDHVEICHELTATLSLSSAQCPWRACLPLQLTYFCSRRVLPQHYMLAEGASSDGAVVIDCLCTNQHRLSELSLDDLAQFRQAAVQTVTAVLLVRLSRRSATEPPPPSPPLSVFPSCLSLSLPSDLPSRLPPPTTTRTSSRLQAVSGISTPAASSTAGSASASRRRSKRRSTAPS